MMGRQNGLVMIAVLWICALVLWLALQISTETRLQSEEELHQLHYSRALHLAIGGAYEALGRAGQELPIDAGEDTAGTWQPDGQPQVVAYERGQVLIFIEKETEKINVNLVDHEQLKAVIEQAGMEPAAAGTLADVIQDFVDKDDLVRLGGAEKNQYEKMGVPYPPFDGPLHTLDQLLLIPGITQQLFYGGNLTTENGEDGAETPDLPLLPGKTSLFHMLTVYGNNKILQGENELMGEILEPRVWEPGEIYRILSYAKLKDNPTAVLVCVIFRYTPEQQSGYQILFRKIF
jgi:general secretion pathway protein K